MPGALPQVAADGAGDAPTLAQDALSLYWVAGGALSSVAKNGGPIVTLASGNYNGAIARTTTSILLGAKDQIWSLPDATNLPVAWTSFTGAPFSLVLGGQGVYWSATQASPPDLVLGVALADGTATAFKLAEPSTPFGNHPVAAGETAVFYGDGGALHMVALATGADTVLYPGDPTSPILGLVTDENESIVYFLAGGVLRGVAVTGQPTIMIDAMDANGSIADGGTDIYWTETGASAGGASFPYLRRLEKATGTVTDLGSAPTGMSPGARAVAVDDACVYWIAGTDGRLMKVAR